MLGSGDHSSLHPSLPCVPVRCVPISSTSLKHSAWKGVPPGRKQEFGETMETGLSLPKHLCPACRVSPGAHPQSQMGVQRQAVGHLKGHLPPPSWPHWAHQPITSYPEQPSANMVRSVLSFPGGTCQALFSPWPRREAGLSWDVWVCRCL